MKMETSASADGTRFEEPLQDPNSVPMRSPSSCPIGESKQCIVTPTAFTPEPATSRKARQETPHRPPINFVVINDKQGSGWKDFSSSIANTDGLDLPLEIEPGNTASEGDQTRIPSNENATSFLHTSHTKRPMQGGPSLIFEPRKLTSSQSHSSIEYSDDEVGRKRRAFSINSPLRCTSKSPVGIPPRCELRIPMNTEGKKDVAVGFEASSTMDRSNNSCLNLAVSPSPEPPFMGMMGSSYLLPSTHGSPSPDSMKSGSHYFGEHRKNSSFSPYGESPACALYMAVDHAVSDSPNKSRTPSPRQVPLTVISNSRSSPTQVMGMSCVLHSLDNLKNDGEGTSVHGERASMSHSSHSTAGSSLSSEECAVHRERMHWPTMPTPSKTRLPSLTPRMPSKQISLAPKMMLSGSMKKSAPVFPPPLGADERPIDSRYTGASHPRLITNRCLIGENMDPLDVGCAMKNANAVSPCDNQYRALATPPPLMTPVWKNGSSELPVFSGDGTEGGKCALARRLQNEYTDDFWASAILGLKQPAQFRAIVTSSKSSSISCSDGFKKHEEGVSLTCSESDIERSRVNATLVLGPSDARDSQHLMLGSTGWVQHDDAEKSSLSDSGDEFFLFDPVTAGAKSTEAVKSNPSVIVTGGRRVKHKLAVGLKSGHAGARQHQKVCMYSAGARELLSTSTTESTSLQHPSSKSLSTSQDPSSSTSSSSSSYDSLFGIGIAQEEGGSISSSLLFAGKLHSSGSQNAQWPRTSDGASRSSGSLCQKRSEHSLGPLGNDLGAPNGEGGRDLLFTPPTVQSDRALSPPPLAPNHMSLWEDSPD